jgi:hypothetical protein
MSFLLLSFLFSSTKLKRSEQFLPGREGEVEEGDVGVGKRQRAQGRDDSNNVCTYE